VTTIIALFLKKFRKIIEKPQTIRYTTGSIPKSAIFEKELNL
jgi:hypothetical protein